MINRNIEELRKKYPYLSSMESVEISSNIRVEDSKRGNKTLIYNDSYIHSRFDPEKEALKYVNSLEEASLFVLAGIGLGYTLDNIIKGYPDSKIVVYEPNRELFKTLLLTRDFVDIINNPKVYFIIDKKWQVIENLLGSSLIKRVKYIPLIKRVQEDKELFTPLEEFIRTYNRRIEINKNTLKKFGKLWVKNQCLNLSSMTYSGDISSIFNKFQGIPGIIVSAGPSLEEIIPYLKSLSNKFLILAVDTAYKSLLEEGIEPDIVMSIDAQYWNARHLEGVTSKKTILLADSSIQPAAIRQFHNRTYFTKSTFPLGNYFEQSRSPLSKIRSGGSVSTTIWDFAQKLGLSEIFFIGQDLGYPGYITHFKNSYFEKQMLNSCNRLNPVETQSFSYIYKGFPTWVESNMNTRLLSDKRMAIYINWFNELCKGHNLTPSYNLSKWGCKIEGIPYRELKELLHYPAKREEIQKILEPLYKRDDYLYREGILKSAQNFKNVLGRLVDLGERAYKLTLKIERLYKDGKNTNKELRELSNLDRSILGIDFSELLSFLIDPLIEKILENSSRTPFEALLESRSIYRELTYSGHLHLKHINNGIKNLKESDYTPKINKVDG